MARQQQSNAPTQTKPGRGGQGRVEDQGASDERNMGRAQEEEADGDELDDEDDLDDESEDEEEEA
jgi:hypothetical protein